MAGRTRRRRAGRPGARLLAWCVAVGVSVAALSCVWTTERRAAVGWPPMLGAVPQVPGKPADNAECLVCHMDFKKELIATKHARIGVGCFTCHGPSAAHGDDEANIITPDVTFGRAEITPFCETCHRTHKRGETFDAFVAKWTDKRRPNGRWVSADSVCTDCHGNHAVLRPDQLEHLPPG